jgi:Family of unknown function (DUF6399)
MTLCQATTETTDRPDPCYSSCMDAAEVGDANSGQATRAASCFWSQMDTARAVADFSDPLEPPCSQRRYAEEHGIPRSTLGNWLRKDYPDHLDPAVVAFFRCPSGLAWLRRLVLALLLHFHHRHPCGIRPISQFLEQVELHHFVASSYGALYELDQHIQDDLRCFGKEERARLAEGMTDKALSLCLDENFHARSACLVGMEPVSNFILVEAYAQQRDSLTWAKAIHTACEGLPVHIVAIIGDQASGIIRCAEKEFQTHYQPELFHLQRDLAKAVLPPLTRPVQQAKKDLDKAAQQTQQLEQAEQQQPCSVDLGTMLQAVQEELQAEESLQQEQQELDHAVEQIRTMSAEYHPYDRETARAVSPEQMQAKLSAPVTALKEVVEEAGMGERAHQAVVKAQEWVVVLVGCLGWFWKTTRSRLEELDVSEAAQRTIEDVLMAGYYWEAASQREKDPDERRRLAERAKQRQEQSWAKGGVLAALSDEEKAAVQRVARECAGLFCRSSSCVEGRNGRLSLFHHGQTYLSEKRLQTLTVIHNYVVRREDGTTAAERFFGKKHRDAFSWLLQRMPDLPRPAAKRPPKTSKGESVAA